MKQPSWEPTPGNLATWLNANLQAQPVDLFTIRLAGGGVLRYASGDAAVTANGTTWVLGPSIRRSRVRQTIGVSVDTLSITVEADNTVLVNGTPILQALAKGAFTGATLRLERAFLDQAGACQGLVPVFYGRLGAVKAGRSSAGVEVRSHAELLDVMIPGDVYQPGCRNTVFDANCGLAAAGYTVTGATNANGDSTRRTFTSNSAAVIATPTGWADLGIATFTSGLNLGISRTVRTHVLSGGQATVTAVYPFPFAIQAGDALTLRAGCDKQKATCAAKFANLARFRGEPFVPAPESVT